MCGLYEIITSLYIMNHKNKLNFKKSVLPFVDMTF